MLKIELYLLGKKYADYYQGRYSNAIITKKSVYWLDTDFSNKKFHKQLLEYLLNEGQLLECLLNEGKETFKKEIMDITDKINKKCMSQL